MLLPAITSMSGESVLITARSAWVITLVIATPVLLARFDSTDVVAPVALFVIVVPEGALALTLTTIVNMADSATATLAFEKRTLPVPPTAGVVDAQPAGAVAETKVVLAGVASVSVTLAAASVPMLLRLIVYVRLPPATTFGAGDPALVTDKSGHWMTTVVSCAPLSSVTVGIAEPHAALLALAVKVLATMPFTGIATVSGAGIVPFGP